MVIRSRTGSLRPKTFPDYQVFLSLQHGTETTSYSKAVTNPRWQATKQLEYDALICNGTWTLCPDLSTTILLEINGCIGLRDMLMVLWSDLKQD
jgi:hypothetical protein